MKKAKKVLSFIFTAALIIAVLPMSIGVDAGLIGGDNGGIVSKYFLCGESSDPTSVGYWTEIFDNNSERYIHIDSIDENENLSYDASRMADYKTPENELSLAPWKEKGIPGVTRVIFDGNVTNVGTGSFSDYTTLTRVDFKCKVQEIGDYAFYNTGVTDVYFYGTPAEWNSVIIGTNNTVLETAAIHYICEIEGGHTVGTEVFHDADNHWKVCTVCDEKVEVKAHSFTELNLNDDGHWYVCACGQADDVSEHTYGEWIVTKPATLEETGTRERTCSVCSHKQTETIEKLEFILGDVDCDGQITNEDSILVTRYLARLESLTQLQIKSADVNGDGEINIGDAVLIKMYVSGNINTFCNN